MAQPVSSSNPALQNEVAFLAGVDGSGRVSAGSYWTQGQPAGISIAHKWGGDVAGSAGGTVTYAFDSASSWNAIEKGWFSAGLSLWSAVANVKFAETANAGTANVVFNRGSDGGAWENGGLTSSGPNAFRVGSTTLAHPAATGTVISIDTSVAGFGPIVDLKTYGGYPIQTLLHEQGHMLGLGHGGFYNGAVNPATEQQTAFDTRLWTLMSYIEPATTTAKYAASYPVTGTAWRGNDPTTWMPLDILAVQRLYGVAVDTPLSGGQTYGFNCNIQATIAPFFDFTKNTTPVITVWNGGTGNTLDLSGFSQASVIDLNPGGFSSCAGLVNNVAMAFGTIVETAIGGSGNDRITGSGLDNVLVGGLGIDILTGGAGRDVFKDTLAGLSGDMITDLTGADTIWITDASLATLRYSYANSALSLALGSGAAQTVTIAGGLIGYFTATADARGGVGLTFHSNSAAFGFKLTEARFTYQGAAVLVDGPDGSHTVLSGVTRFSFADGTVDRNAGNDLVDDLFYFDANRDVWAAHLDAGQHFSDWGWREGRDPNAFFSSASYFAANRVANPSTDPARHYDLAGWKNGNDPSVKFDTTLYLVHNPDVKAAGIDPLLHYLQYGQAEGRQTYTAIGPSNSFNHGSFDAEFYLLLNPDVATAVPKGGDSFAFAYQHFQNWGWREGRDPNAHFDTSGYLAKHGDVRDAGIDPLWHYDQYGWKEGRDPSTDFDSSQYLAHNPDVAALGLDPLQHYLQYGIYEGRSSFGDGHWG